MHRFAATLLLAAAPALAHADPPKNIIVFVADGCGQSTHRALELWRGEPMVYQSDRWSHHRVATYALRAGPRPTSTDPLAQDPRVVFDPARAWDTSPLEGSAGGYPFHFAGYRWLRATAPDSANTATAIFGGVSTYTGAICVDGAGQPVATASQAASERGMAVGVVSSVAFSHATPACAAGAQVPDRDMYHEIARQMLSNGVCDVIAGPGHPLFDDSAQRRESPKFKFIGPNEWAALESGTAAHETGGAWTLVEDPDAVRRLAEGEVPTPLFIMPRAAQTLQQKRAPWVKGDGTGPGGHPKNTGVPTLLDLTLAALNAVDDNPDGFFLLVEGGAVDWAMHDNQIGRMIEEMTDYHDTIETVCSLLDAGERGFDWSNTLVIVTADHDHLLLGPDSHTEPFQPITDNGTGELPGYTWHADQHSNLPIPLYARGPGAERFGEIPTLADSWTNHDGTPVERQPYFHQVEIGKVLISLVESRRAEAVVR